MHRVHFLIKIIEGIINFRYRRPAYLNGIETPSDQYAAAIKSTAFVPFGRTAFKKLGINLKKMSLNNVGVLVDKNLINLPLVKAALDSMATQQINFEVFDQDSTQSKNTRIPYSKKFDGFVVIGGGMIEICKEDYLGYGNATIGRAIEIKEQLKAFPLTVGAGSIAGDVAIFDPELTPNLKANISQNFANLPRSVLNSDISVNSKTENNPIYGIWARFAFDALKDTFQGAIFNTGLLKGRSTRSCESVRENNETNDNLPQISNDISRVVTQDLPNFHPMIARGVSNLLTAHRLMTSLASKTKMCLEMTLKTLKDLTAALSVS